MSGVSGGLLTLFGGCAVTMLAWHDAQRTS
jgi:hypothetical protein